MINHSNSQSASHVRLCTGTKTRRFAGRASGHRNDRFASLVADPSGPLLPFGNLRLNIADEYPASTGAHARAYRNARESGYLLCYVTRHPRWFEA